MSRLSKDSRAALADHCGYDGEPDVLSAVVERLLQQQADTAFLVGASYGREQERARIIRDLKAVDPVEWALAGVEAGNDAIFVVNQVKA